MWLQAVVSYLLATCDFIFCIMMTHSLPVSKLGSSDLGNAITVKDVKAILLEEQMNDFRGTVIRSV